MAITPFKTMERAYGFEEVAIVPGDVTINPAQTDISFKIADFKFSIPVIASAMDAVVDPAFALMLGKMGGLGVLHLEGVQTKFEDPGSVLEEISRAPQSEITSLLQRVYSEPVKENLVAERIQAIKKGGVVAAASVGPANAKRLSNIAKEAGLDILVVASTVTTARHLSKSYHGLVFSELKEELKMPVVVGNCVSFSAAMELMKTGIDAILVGVGPGAACTTREVLGIGVPQVTATLDSAAAREAYLKKTGRYVTVITDGGMRIGSDVCKAFAAGADAVMIGSPFARCQEAPGRGFHWGMAHPHPSLPRGTRIKVGQNVTLEKLLFGPTSATDGSENLVNALRTAMGVCGMQNIREFQKVKMVIAPSIKTEGKYFQAAQQCSL